MQNTNYTVAFQTYSPKVSTGCFTTAFLFGPRCGFCRDDCDDLMAQVWSISANKQKRADKRCMVHSANFDCLVLGFVSPAVDTIYLPLVALSCLFLSP